MKPTLRNMALAVISLLLFISVTFADEDRFIIGYVSHPRVTQFYKPLMEQVYADIGIKAEFVEVGGERACGC
ncbi:hypothetical protein [Alteromonas gracilis]|uniref:hypothetical protein n=1 Tax=Alteromonas gracilis TaxID=1479524 RepID=UPI0030CF0FBD